MEPTAPGVSAWLPSTIISGSIPAALKGTLFAVGPAFEEGVHPLDRRAVVTRVSFVEGRCHVLIREMPRNANTPHLFTPRIDGVAGAATSFAQHRGWTASPTPHPHPHNYQISFTKKGPSALLHLHSLAGSPCCMDPYSLQAFGSGSYFTEGEATHFRTPLRVAELRQEGDGSGQMGVKVRYTAGGATSAVVVAARPSGIITAPPVTVPANTVPHTCLPTERTVLLHASNMWSAEFINDARSILRTAPHGLFREGHQHRAFDAAAIASAKGYRSFNNIVVVPRAKDKPLESEILPCAGFIVKFLGIVKETQGTTVAAAVVCPEEIDTDSLCAALYGESSVSARNPTTRTTRKKAPFELQLLSVTSGVPISQTCIANDVLGCAYNTGRGVRPCRYVYSFSGLAVRKHDLVTKTEVEWNVADDSLHGFTVVHIVFVEADPLGQSAEDEGYLLAQLHPLFFAAKSYTAAEAVTHYAVLHPGSAQITLRALIRMPSLIPPHLGSLHTRDLFVDSARL